MATRTAVAPLIMAPTAAGCPCAAALRLGPAHILAQVEADGLDVRWPALGGDRPPGRPLAAVGAATAAVMEAVGRAAAGGHVPVVAGGDHTVALGGILGAREGLRRRQGRDIPLFVLWLDAHADANTEVTSPTGNLHGMALAGALGVGPLALAEPLAPGRLALAGIRALDPGEVRFIASRPELMVWEAGALRGAAWAKPADALLARVAAAGGRLYLSLDLDVFDPGSAPGVAVPERGGARPEPVLALLERLRASGLLAGADVVELYPSADREEQTARLAARALAALGAVPVPSLSRSVRRSPAGRREGRRAPPRLPSPAGRRRRIRRRRRRWPGHAGLPRR